MRFIATTRADRRSWESELAEEVEARDVWWCMESKRMEGGDEQENGEEK